MGLGGALLGISALQGVTSIAGGYAQSAEDKANASLYGLQAGLIQEQGDIQQGQMRRQAAMLLGTQTADVAAKGIQPSGSAAAVMLESQTQMNIDMAIARFNTSMGINQANAKANLLKAQASQAVMSGYSNAFTNLLSGTAKYYQYSGGSSINMSQDTGYDIET